MPITPVGRASTIALWKPPNPLPTVSTASICCSRAVQRHVVEVALRVAVRRRLAVGGTTPCSIASAQAAISIEPIAPSECPIIDLIELTGMLVRVVAEARLNAAVSCRSFCFVPEPCALM